MERICHELGVQLRAKRGTRALVAQSRYQGIAMTLAFPQTFMNNSGEAVVRILRNHPISSPGDLVVIHDELDLPTGVVRVKAGGGLAGHNGLKSLASHLKTQEFTRIRIGIGRPSRSGEDVLRWVLSRPSDQDAEALDEGVKIAVQAALCLVSDGVDKAMNQFNSL